MMFADVTGVRTFSVLWAGWVKASEEASNIDTSSTKGYYGVRVLQAALFGAGMVVSAAESIGLQQPTDISF
jgi:hypothetical protein